MELASHCLLYGGNQVATSICKDRKQRYLEPDAGSQVSVAVPEWSQDTQNITRPDTKTVFRLNTNQNEFLNPWNTKIAFNIQVRTPSAIGVYFRSMADLIQDVLIESAQGQELERIDNVNILNSFITASILSEQYQKDTARNTLTHKFTPTDFSLIDSREQTANTLYPYNVLDNTYAMSERTEPNLTEFSGSTGKLHYIEIPLPLICGLFRANNLLPPQLTNGMKITITWAPAENVLNHNVNPVEGLFVNEPQQDENGNWLLRSNLSTHVHDFDDLYVNTYNLSKVQLIQDMHIMTDAVSNFVKSVHKSAGLDISIRSFSQCSPGTPVTSAMDLSVTGAYSQASRFVGTVRAKPKDKNLQAYIPLMHYQPRARNFSYQIEHNNTLYPPLALTSAEAQYSWWIEAFGSSKNITDSQSSNSWERFSEHHGNTFVYNLNRCPVNLDTKLQGHNITANPNSTSQEINGNNRCKVRVNKMDMNDTYVHITDSMSRSSTRGLHYKQNNITLKYPRIFTPAGELVTLDTEDTLDMFAYTWIEHYRHFNINAQTGVKISI